MSTLRSQRHLRDTAGLGVDSSGQGSTPVGPPTLTDLILSSHGATLGVPFFTIVATTANASLVTATASDGTVLTVSGSGPSRLLFGTFATLGLKTITLLETEADATNSPHSSIQTVLVTPAGVLLAADLVAHGTLNGVLKQSLSFTGTAAGAGTLAGIIDNRTLLSGGVVGSLQLAGQMIQTGFLAGDVLGRGTLAGTLTQIQLLAGGVVGTGLITGNLGQNVLLNRGVVGSGLLSGTLTQALTVAGGVVGSGLITGTMTRTNLLTGIVGGNGVLSAVLSQILSVSGAVVGSGVLSGVLGRDNLLAADLVGRGTLAGTMSQSLLFSGGVVSSGVLTGLLSRDNVLSAGLAGFGTLAGTLTQTVLLAGGVVASGLMSGAFGSTRLVLIAGQSNAISKATNGVAPPSDIAAIDPARVLIYDGTSFVGYVAGVNSSVSANFPTAWGTEGKFAVRWLADHPIGILRFVKHGEDGVRLAPDTGRDWSPSSVGEAFDAMTTLVNGSKVLIAAFNTTPQIDVHWLQGESDALTQSYADAYQTNLTAAIAAMRTRWGTAATKVGVVRVYKNNLNPGGPAVRTAQNAVTSADALSYLVDTDDLTLFDTYHYNAAGVAILGGRIYDAIESGATIEDNSVVLGAGLVSSGLLTGTLSVISTSISLTGALVSTGFLTGVPSISGLEDAATTAFFAAIARDGLAAPTTAWKAAYDQLFKDAKGGSDPWFTTCDVLYILGSYDDAVARRNLRQDAFHATKSATPSFTAKTGFLCSTGKLLTGFNPATAPTPAYVQNSAHVMFGTATDLPTTASDVHNWTGSTGVFINCRTSHSPNKTEGRLNTAANFTIQPGSASSAHHWVFVRPNATQTLAYQEGTLWQTFASNSTAVASFAFEIGALGTVYTTRRYDRASIGGLLTAAQAAQQEANLNTFFAATAGLP